MSSFAHHVLRNADVKVTRKGKAVRIEIDATPMDRMVIEIKDATLAVVAVEDAAFAGRVPQQAGGEHGAS